MKKYLIIETFPNTPHLETSLEIAQKLKKENNEVFFFLGRIRLTLERLGFILVQKNFIILF